MGKTLANTLAFVITALPAFLCRCSAHILGPERAFPGWSQAFSLIPGLTGVFLRRAFYRQTLARCGDDCCIAFGTIFSGSQAEVGNRVYVGAYCTLGEVTLEDDVLLASNVSIMNGSQQHGIERLDVPIREQAGELLPVTIGEDSWIGERAVIAADVGKHCVIGACSIVTKPIPDFAIAVGIPAKVIRYRTDDDSLQKLQADLLSEPTESVFPT